MTRGRAPCGRPCLIHPLTTAMIAQGESMFTDLRTPLFNTPAHPLCPHTETLNVIRSSVLTFCAPFSIVLSYTVQQGLVESMIRAGTLLEKDPGLKTIFEGSEHNYVRCVIADATDPERHFECRVLDEVDIPVSAGEPIEVEVIKVITERRSGIVRFYCRLVKTQA